MKEENNNIENIVKQCCVCNKYDRTLIKPPYLVVRTYLSRTCLARDLTIEKLRRYAHIPLWIKAYKKLSVDCNNYYVERPGEKYFEKK